MNKVLLSLACFVSLLGLSGLGSATPISGCTTISSSGVYMLAGNILSSSATYCINITSNHVVFDGQGYTIDGVYALNTYGVYVYSGGLLTNVTIKNINVRDWHYGIYYRGQNGTLTKNTVSSSRNTGIWLIGLNVNLTYNTVSSALQSGIYLDQSSYINVTNNTVVSNSGDGIRLYYSRYNTLTNNTVSNNNGGIYLANYGNNIIANNTVNSNKIGIYPSSSDNNIIANNTINLNTDYGILLWTSGSNTLYNNYFKNYNNFAFGGTLKGNVWNTTKILRTNIVGGPYRGGNFWANLIGTGFSETCSDSNSDGICNSNYTLTSGNIDYLPLAVSPIYYNASVKPTTLAQGGSVTANATTNYNFSTMWVKFTWYSPSQTVGGNTYVRQFIDAVNESGLYQDAYTTAIDDEMGGWTVRMEFITSGGVQATRYASFTVISVPEFSFLIIPLTLSFLIYVCMRGRLE